MKMNCNVYLNGKGFKAGRKYLSIVKAYSGETLKRKELTPGLLEELESIKAEFSAADVRRTAAVFDLFTEQE